MQLTLTFRDENTNSHIELVLLQEHSENGMHLFNALIVKPGGQMFSKEWQ